MLVGYVSRVEEIRNACNILIENADNIKKNRKEVGWEAVVEDEDHWRGLVNTVMNLWGVKSGLFILDLPSDIIR